MLIKAMRSSDRTHPNQFSMERMVKRSIGRLPRAVTTFWNDTSGIILPYVALMLVVFVGLVLLAIDGARLTSLQTQIQAAADAIALAGARELNQRPGAQSRAISAMTNTAFGNDNTLSGLGTSPTFAYSHAFYQSLPAAGSATDYTGTAPTGSQEQQDLATKFVAVTVAPVTLSTIMPVPLVNAARSVSYSAASFSVGAKAIAGFTAVTVCNVTPIFMCNPYETTGMTDTQATQALINALDPNSPTFSAATLRQQIRMNRSAASISPGNFGWIQTADGCNNSNCMRQNLAAAAGSCYSSFTVSLATGNKNNVENYFDTRFDIYSMNPKPAVSSVNAPSVNVRKGYLPGNKGDWCKANSADQFNPPAQYYTTTPVYTKPPIVSTTGTICKSGNGCTKNVITGVPAADIGNISVGQTITGANIPTLTTVTGVNVAAKTITMLNNATANATESLSIQWPTSPLPLDTSWTGICTSGTCLQGNGQWDCQNYWKINHPGVAVPTIPNPTGAAFGGGVCGTPAATTASRYAVYRYEIAQNTSSGGIDDWSGNGLADNVNNPPGNGENGAPYCAAASGVSGIDTTTGGLDRREFITPIINCLAQNVSGSGSGATVPAAAFAKFFMSQPYETPPPPPPAGDSSTQYIYGEMTGLVASGQNVTILNQVQLYR